MSLTAALGSARSSLMALGVQSSVVSRNIAGASELGYSRKIAVLESFPGNGVYVAAIQRAASAGLFTNVLTATSASAKQGMILDGLQKISAATVDDPELDQSPTAKLNALKQALHQYATAPDNATVAQSAVSAARDVASSLNQATRTVQSVRENADADMAASVANINRLLAQFDTVNTEVMKGTATGADVTDYLDQRDAIISKLSEEIGVSVSIRPNGDAALYTDSGVVLFDKSARSVSFAPTNAYTAGTTGNAVFIDGVPVTGASAVMPLKSGKIAGLAELRDNATVTYQSQLDEIARGLIEAFRETDQSGAALPDVPGLFTYPGAPAMPPGATVSVGLAGTIAVAASVDPASGGNPNLLRDGAISGSSTIWMRRSRSTPPHRASRAATSSILRHRRRAGSKTGARPQMTAPSTRIRCSTAAIRRCRMSTASTWTTRCRRCCRSSVPIRRRRRSFRPSTTC
jgi:flagellar hook-associated protein 1